MDETSSESRLLQTLMSKLEVYLNNRYIALQTRVPKRLSNVIANEII